MNKSTPINQLPSQVGTQNSFVNDQQRQMITQAQQAIGNSTLPQNTSALPSDILNEDDAVIQDMLNNLNHQAQNTEVNQQYQQEELMRLASMNNMNINHVMQPTQYMPQQQQQPQHFYVPAVLQPSLQQKFMHIMSSEFKLAGAVFLAVILVQMVPFHRYVCKYISIDKIPYHDIILRGVLAALAVILAKKMFM